MSIDNNNAFIKSPLNYIGGKYKILNQILPLFPNNINCFVDLFAGGCNVSVNVSAKKIVANDNLKYLVDLYSSLRDHTLEEVLEHVHNRINNYSLSLTNDIGYKEMRDLYNIERNPLDLFILTAYSFNHQIRFNSSHQFNSPFGRERSSFNSNMEKNLINFVKKIHEIDLEFSASNFNEFDLSGLGKNDFVYCDPPYLITTGSYNDGKRGFTGWGENEERALLSILDDLDARGVKFALSNVLLHKGRANLILNNWIKEHGYVINDIRKDYSNSSYHTGNRDKTSTREVLITNYGSNPQQPLNEAYEGFVQVSLPSLLSESMA